MVKYRVAIELDRGDKYPGFREQIKRLIEDGRFEIRFLRDRHSNPGRSVTAVELHEADFYILMGHRFIDESTFDKHVKLKWIGRFAAGFDNVDVSLCNQKGILISNSPVALRESVAELALGFILAHKSRLSFFNQHIREKYFIDKSEYPTRCAAGSTLGLLGAGGIARKLAELVAPLRMNIIAYDPYADKQKLSRKGIELTSLESLLGSSDIVSCHLPLTNDTRRMLREEHFKMMKPDAFFINTSRGGIYEDSVLAKALKKGFIAGAGIDVFENEPDIKGNPLLDCENAILTPHIAGATNNQDAITAIAESLVNSIFKLAEGDLPDAIINPEILDTHVPDDKLSPSYKPEKK